MKRQIIAIDIDDVLASSTESLRREVNERFGVNLLPEHYKVPGDYWGYYERVWRQNSLGEITLAELDLRMEEDQSHMSVHEKALEVVKQLRKEYELVVVTARDLSWQAATHRWLGSQFPGMFSQIIFADGKAGLKHKSKGQLCKEVGASWLIDDNVEHAKTAIGEGIKVILFGDYGWHQNIPKNVTRCKDWPAVLEYFDGRG